MEVKAWVILRNEQARLEACVKGEGVDQNSMQFWNSIYRLAIYLRLKEKIKGMSQDYLPWWFGENS